MGTSLQSMVTGCTVLLIFLVASDIGCWAEDTPKDEKNESQKEETDAEVHPPWLGSLLGLTRRDLRADKDDMFWATRGKRSGDDSDFWAIRGKKQYIKPNGFFQALSTPTPGKRTMDLWMNGKRSFKPNGLFSTMKRASLKPNSLFGVYKRAGLKPNGLFGSYKRAGLKPNGLFGAYKRPSLKPNGLFGAYKRAGLKPNGLFGAYKRASMKPNGLFGTYKRDGLKPNGLFGAYKRSQVPTGLWVPTQFGYEDIDDDNEETTDDEDQDQEYFNYVEDDISYDYDEIDLEEPQAEKREDAEFWAARGKKEDADFWATRG